MAWDFTTDRPIYLQLIEQIEIGIVAGVYKPGEKLLSVRELAAEAAVNPNTMQKALSELEQKGLVFSQRTSGRFVTEDEGLIKVEKDRLALNQIKDFVQKMQVLGFDIKETISLMQNIKGDELK